MFSLVWYQKDAKGTYNPHKKVVEIPVESLESKDHKRIESKREELMLTHPQGELVILEVTK